MNDDILSAVISAIATIIAALLTSKNRRSNFKKKKSDDLSSIQLCELFEPLDMLFSLGTYKEIDELIHDVKTIVLKQYKIVPPMLIDDFKGLLTSKNPTMDDIAQFRMIVSTHYNWLRKKHGYPYRVSSIHIQALSYDYLVESLQEIFKGWCLCLMLFSISRVIFASIAYWVGTEILFLSNNIQVMAMALIATVHTCYYEILLFLPKSLITDSECSVDKNSVKEFEMIVLSSSEKKQLKRSQLKSIDASKCQNLLRLGFVKIVQTKGSNVKKTLSNSIRSTQKGDEYISYLKWKTLGIRKKVCSLFIEFLPAIFIIGVVIWIVL